MQNNHNQIEAVLRCGKVSNADLVLNIYFSNAKTLILQWLWQLLCEPLIPQILFAQVYNLGKWLYVFVISRTCFRVNPRSIVAWMSRNSLLEADAKYYRVWIHYGMHTWHDKNIQSRSCCLKYATLKFILFKK